MPDEEVVALLTEIRNLQKLQVENQRNAIEVQAKSATLQAKAVQQQKRAFVFLGLLALGLIVFAVWSFLPRH